MDNIEKLEKPKVKSHQEQIAMIHWNSLGEFLEYIKWYTLCSMAINEFLKPRIPQCCEKYTAYIKQHGHLEYPDEVRLLESSRKDLQEIYFEYGTCDKRSVKHIVRNLGLAKLYYASGKSPDAKEQMELVRSENWQAIVLFIKHYDFAPEPKKLFLASADKKLKSFYYKQHPQEQVN